MNKYNTRFGSLNIDKKDIITFEKGIPGFLDLKKFYLLTYEESKPIVWLVSLEDPTVAFPMISPNIINKNYSFTINEETKNYLELITPEDLIFFSVITLSEKIEDSTINLLAPILISLKNNKATQYIIENSEYSLKYKFYKNITSLDTKKEGGK